MQSQGVCITPMVCLSVPHSTPRKASLKNALIGRDMPQRAPTDPSTLQMDLK
jgi:hypothetical protein